MSEEAMVTRSHLLDMQVCVPSDWTDEQVIEFANRKNPAGTTHGWFITKEGDEVLQDSHERVQCSGPNGREGFVHVMLHC